MAYLEDQNKIAAKQADSEDDENSEEENEGDIPEKGLSDEYIRILSILSTYVDYQAIDPLEYESESYRKIFLLHILNHVLSMRLKIRENNQQQLSEQVSGYTRARALILAPYRIDALTIVQEIRNMLKFCGITNIEGLQKFEEKFADDNVSINFEGIVDSTGTSQR